MKQFTTKTRLARAAMTLLVAMLTTATAWAQQTIPFTESFGTSKPVGWSMYFNNLDQVQAGTKTLESTDRAWYFGSANGVFDNHAYAWIYYSTSRWLVTPLLNLTNNLELTFSLALTSASGDLNAPNETDGRFIVLVSTDGMSTWTILREWNNSGSSDVYNDIPHTATGENVSISLSDYANQNVYIAFYAEASSQTTTANQLHIDNVSVDHPICKTCQVPTDVTISDVTAHSATVTWTSDATEFDLSVGNNLIEGVTSPYTLTNLNPGTAYSVKVCANYGTNGYSQWTDAVSFTTTEPCPVPTDLAATAYGQSATLTWTSGASSFDVAYSTDGTANPNDLTYTTVSTNSYTIDNLDLDTDYYFWVRANCGDVDGYSAWVGPVSVHIGYCVPAPTSVDNDGISNVTFGTGDNVVNNDTPKATYADYTNQIGAVQAGVESTIAITFKTNFTYNTYVWVDLDNSLSFDADEVICYGESASANPTTLNLNFIIPANQALGDYRLRIGSADSGLGSDPTVANPCYASTYACFQDYTLRVLEAPSCLPPTGVTISNVTTHAATISWTSGADAWQVQLNEENPIDVTETTYNIEGLIPETTFTVKVRTKCGDNDYSAWTNAVSFTTGIACPVPTDLAVILTPGDGSVATLSWTEPGDATKWVLEYGTNADFTNATSVTVNDTPSANLISLTAETTYYARVKANCGGDDGESQWSNTITFTPTDNSMLTVNDGTDTNSYVPVYGYYVDDNSYSQFIIPATALADMQWGAINRMTFYGSNTGSNPHWDNAQFEVYMTETDKTTLSALADWGTMKKVMNAAHLEISDGKMVVTLDAPYQYMDGNLMIGIKQTVSGSWSSCTWTGVTATGSSMGGYDTSVNQQNFLPKTTFEYIPGTAPTCLKPTELALIGEPTYNSAQLSWTPGSEGQEAWQICVNGDEEHLIDIDTDDVTVSGATVTYQISGLLPETDYEIKIRGNCGNGDISLWSNTASFTTPVQYPKPTNLAAGTPGRNKVQLSWTKNGTETAWQICLNDDEDNLIDIDTDDVSINESTITYQLTGLTLDTDYIVKVRAYIDATSQSYWSNIVSFTTEATYPRPTNVTASNLTHNSATISWDSDAESYNVKYATATVTGTTLEPVFEDGFESGLTGWTTYARDYDDATYNWQQYNGNLVDEGNHTGDYVAASRSWHSSNGDQSVDNWLVSPQMTLGNTLKLWVATNGGFPDSYAVYVSTGSGVVPSSGTGDFTVVANLTPATGTWTEQTYDLSAYAGQQGYVAIRHKDSAKDHLLVDDFGVYNTVNTYSYGTKHTLTTNETSCSLTGLTAETLYEVQVQADHGSEGTSGWSKVYFTTPDACTAPTSLVASDITTNSATLSWANTQESYNLRYREVYFYESFEDETMPTGWTTIDANNDGHCWQIGSGKSHSGANGAYDISFIYQTSNISPDDYLVSPLLDLQGTLRVWLTGNETDNNAETFAIYLSTTGNTAADFTTTLVAESTTTNSYVEYTADLSSYTGQKGYIAIRHFNCTDQREIYVDDFGLYGSEDWVTVNNVDDATHTLTGLQSNTLYEWQVKGLNCNSAGSETEWSEVAKFTTMPEAVDITLADNATDNATTIEGNHGVYANVKLNGRKLYKDNSWNTLCLPFGIANINAEGNPLNGAIVRELRNASISGTTLTLNFKNATTAIKAGTPYIVKWEVESNSTIEDPVFNGVSIDKTVHNYDNGENGDARVRFLGTYDAITFNEEGFTEDRSILFMGDNNALFYPQVGVDEQSGDNVYPFIGACRAYFKIGEDGAGARQLTGFVLNFGDGEAQGIESLTTVVTMFAKR